MSPQNVRKGESKFFQMQALEIKRFGLKNSLVLQIFLGLRRGKSRRSLVCARFAGVNWLGSPFRNPVA
jgi:hypothetical protein